MVTTSAARLHIRQWHAEYLVAVDHPAPEALRARLDAAVAHDLAPVLAAILAPWFARQTSGLWFIRRLDLAVDLNVAWEREQVARVLAQQITRELALLLHEGGDGANVLWFPGRAAYLARFLVDLAAGAAWGKWYYAAFDGLRLLPVSAALRTALVDEPALGQAALAEMADDDLAQVGRVLTIHDARLIVDRLAASLPPADATRCLAAIWAMMEKTALSGWSGREEPVQALHLYVQMSRQHPSLAGPTLRSGVLALLRLAACLAHSPVDRAKKLLTALRHRDLTALYVVAGATDAEVLRPLLDCPTQWVQAVGQALLARNTASSPQERSNDAGVQQTPFGGLFFLLPLLDQLPLAEATHDWPDLAGTSAVRVVRLLLLAKGCGQARTLALFYDPLVRELLGVEAHVAAADVIAWQRRITAVQRQHFLATLARWQQTMLAVRAHLLILKRLPAPGRPLVVLQDSQRGIWLDVWHFHPLRFASQVQRWLAALDPKAILFCEEEWVTSLQNILPSHQMLTLPTAAQNPLVLEDPHLSELLARQAKLGNDLTYLTLPASLCGPRSVDLALSAAAQALLRNFAWRLPGFARSSLAYLFDNFLDCPASLEDAPDRCILRLGRPPLNLVLNMTGMARASYRVGWRGDRPFVLFQEG